MSNDVGRYRKLYARIWRHPGFTALSEGEKILALYLVTGPQTNRLGLYVLSIATAAEDLGTLPQTLTKRLVNVCQTFGWLFDKGSRVFFIPSWFKWNPPENVNVMKGSLKDLNEIPPCGLVDAFSRNIETLPQTVYETFVEGLRQRLSNGMPIQDQYQDPYQKQEQKPRAARGSAGAARHALTLTQTNTEDQDGSEGKDKALLSIAREALKSTNPHAPIDHLLDCFGAVYRLKGLTTDYSRADATGALNQALSERRTASA